ncbi:tetratricopeptide repeat protein (macronuclear) [Tetrahymena thermophila SB210]|uniref:Tetratricopeptide repeat protein n=1 Tax=Tetrahymena thermophila (strain SB210) TaxID=312017 RepID=W7WZC0_TETTS|nr:tetratricopeptide repeat protein [Tetrahymena thermophila SB210]EWS72240.1 tetratricopeptide repeat protein [Tetrahymena thermophila SB210]|eukprot:XP_012655180.1 tetratricopeptide repeat protein [Tetrahymena thermophila SB210]
MSAQINMKDSQVSTSSINTQNTSIIQSEQDIRIRWICSFWDGRTHAQFNDKSGLILHREHECFTYFSKMGNKLRFMSKNIPCTESIEFKVNLVFKNLNQYNDVPTIKSEKLYSDQEEILNSQKISSCIWSLNGEDTDFEIDDQGNIIEYLQLIPKKKATWENKLNNYDEDDNEDQIEGLNGERNAKNQLNSGNFDFHKDFLQKYNLKKQSDSQKANKGKVKLAFPYIKMKKIYTIFSFPERWTLPLYLLWSKLERQEFSSQIGKDVQLVHQPHFQQDFIDYLHIDISSESYEDVSFKNYIREKYGLNKINQTEAITELPNIGMLNQIQFKNINSENLWSNDEAFPLFDQPRYSERIQYTWKDGYTSWISREKEIYLFNDKENLFLFSTQSGKYFHEVEENDVRSLENEKVINVLQIWRDDEKSILLNSFSKLREHDSIISNKVEVISEYKQGNKLNKQLLSNNEEKEESIASLYSDNYEVLHKSENDLGKFEAFKNGCIKILFRDRTILRWMKGSDQVHIISRYGDQVNILVQSPQEFQEYVDRAIEFREYCFTDPKEKLEKERKQQELKELINFEMNKNERFLTILKGKVPEEISRTLKINEQPSQLYNPCNSINSQSSQQELYYSTPLKQSNYQNGNLLGNSQQQQQYIQYNFQDQQNQDMNEMIQNMLRQNEQMLYKLKQVL